VSRIRLRRQAAPDSALTVAARLVEAVTISPSQFIVRHVGHSGFQQRHHVEILQFGQQRGPTVLPVTA
jgi:hypothetical protein